MVNVYKKNISCSIFDSALYQFHFIKPVVTANVFDWHCFYDGLSKLPAISCYIQVVLKWQIAINSGLKLGNCPAEFPKKHWYVNSSKTGKRPFVKIVMWGEAVKDTSHVKIKYTMQYYYWLKLSIEKQVPLQNCPWKKWF